jgi:hypothetical protein
MTNEEIKEDLRFKHLFDLNLNIRDLKLEVLKLQNDYELLKNEQESIRRQNMAEISAEKSDDGKKKFNNEDQRKNEFQKRLENDEFYYESEKRLSNLNFEIQEKNIEILFQNNNMENYRLFVK